MQASLDCAGSYVKASRCPWSQSLHFLPAVASKEEGDGQPALVFPGLLANDSSTSRLRRSLDQSGFRSFGWNLGTNTGFRPELIVKAELKIEYIAQCCSRKDVLIGWSLGGLYAREIAKRRPDLILLVMTLSRAVFGRPSRQQC